MTKNDLRHLNVFAEVRGKYARPPPINHKQTGIPLLAPKENSLVARPLTAGSLKPRSFSYSRNNVQELEENKKADKTSAKPYIRRYKPIVQNNGPSAKQEIDRLVIDHSLEEDNTKTVEKNNQETYNENNDSPLDLDENYEKADENEEIDREKTSQYSGLTTTSQKKYIQELETLLRQEKLKRIQLEESLKKAIESNS